MKKRFLHFLAISAATISLFTGVLFLSDCRAEDKFEEVIIRTTMGDIIIELNREKAPLTVANFLQYVNDGFYVDTIFHRVVKDFVIQGGGFDTNLNRKSTRSPIESEVGNGLSNVAYTIAMARSTGLDSATSQFYINLKDNPELDTAEGGYTVFGRVVEGDDVVDAIGNLDTNYQDVPLEPVIINRISREDDAEYGRSSDSSTATCFINTL